MGLPRQDNFALQLEQRLRNVSDLEFVRSDNYVLLKELLASAELSVALREAGFQTVTLPGNKANSSRKVKWIQGGPLGPVDSAIESFVQEVVKATIRDGKQLFEYYGDTGSGSWIRLADTFNDESWGTDLRAPRTAKNSAETSDSGAEHHKQACQDELPTLAMTKQTDGLPAHEASETGKLNPTLFDSGSTCKTGSMKSRPGTISMLPAWAAKKVETTAGLQTKCGAQEAGTCAQPCLQIEKSEQIATTLPTEELPSPETAALHQLFKVPAAWGGCRAWSECEQILTSTTNLQSSEQLPAPKEASSPLEIGADPKPSRDVGMMPVEPDTVQNEGRKVQAANFASTRMVRGHLKSFCSQRDFGFARCQEWQEDLYITGGCFDGPKPSTNSRGIQIEMQLDHKVVPPHVVSARFLQRGGSLLPNATDVLHTPSRQRGRLKSFSSEKRFGFIHLEDGKGGKDIFVHASSFAGEKPHCFHGLPGLPAVGQEIEFSPVNCGGRDQARDATIVAPALPLPPAQRFANALTCVLRKPEQYLPEQPDHDGWVHLPALLACDFFHQALEALSPGSSDVLQDGGRSPERLLQVLEELSVCVAAPSASAARQTIAREASSMEGFRSRSFHLWLQDSCPQPGATPKVERLWLRLAHCPRNRTASEWQEELRGSHKRGMQKEENRSEHSENGSDDLEWWQVGGRLSEAHPGTSRHCEPDLAESKSSHTFGNGVHFKTRGSSPSMATGTASHGDILRVLSALPTDAPSAVRQYLIEWARRIG